MSLNILSSAINTSLIQLYIICYYQIEGDNKQAHTQCA